ncbi:MAG: glycosyltransferase [Anaerolineales bacterium]
MGGHYWDLSISSSNISTKDQFTNHEHLTSDIWIPGGDVEPFIALGNGLDQAGHQVNLAAPESFSNLLKNDQIQFFGLPGDPQQMV